MVMGKENTFLPEVREQAARLVFEQTKDNESLGATIYSVLESIGYVSPSEYKKAHYTGQEGLAVGAGLIQ
jgi:hypothetical protein